MINIKNVTKIYTKNKKDFYANDDISLDIKKGEIVGFLGANGAGKTTLIKGMCNLISLTSGDIFIDGENIASNPNIVHEKVGVVLEGARNLYNFLTIDYNINYFSLLNRLDVDTIEDKKIHLLKLFDLEKNRYEVVNNLSRGMQQKVAIVLAILKNPDILILDEPTLGLDVMSKIKMKKLLKNLSRDLNKTLIISSHDIDMIESICDKVAIFREGKLIKYDTISNLKISAKKSEYLIVVENNNETLKSLESYSNVIVSKDENFIKLRTKNISNIIDRIDNDYIVKIEKDTQKIENILAKGEI